MHYKEVSKASNLVTRDLLITSNVIVRLTGETAGSKLLQADRRSQDSKIDRSVQRRL